MAPLRAVIARLPEYITAERQKPYVKVYKTGQLRECRPGVDAVNRFLTTFRCLLNKARDEWEWVDGVPKVKALKGAKSRVRWITRAEADRLISALPHHLAAITEFSLQTVYGAPTSRTSNGRRSIWPERLLGFLVKRPRTAKLSQSH
jgi:hypothetical protein